MNNKDNTKQKNVLTLGVLGHVDHGKTALVRALTGMETDRLREERERGLSIVLGFAFLETPHGSVDLIDVPGHEAFIRAMIGGATALDGVMLCVAANEGVMPQTIEHFQIARLLGVGRGLIVITKSDLADDRARAALRTELQARARGTFLEGASIHEVSAVSGAGLDAVREAVAAMAAVPVERDTSGAFFVPLDRVFTMRGFGLVATGTLRGGVLRVGDAVEIVPARKSSTVRALQNHGKPIACAVAGQRIAVNLRGLHRDDIARGDVLCAPGAIEPTQRIDVGLHVLGDAELRRIGNGASVHLLTGTTAAVAKARLLDRDQLEPGSSGFAQLSLDREIATRPAEPILIRGGVPMRTLGGGRVLGLASRRYRRFDARIKQRLEVAASGDIARMVRQRLEEAAGVGVALEQLGEELKVEHSAIEAAVASAGAVRVYEDLAVESSVLQALEEETVAALERFHRARPLKRGLDAGGLSKHVEARTSPGVLQCVLRRLIEQGKIQRLGEVFSIGGYDPFAKLGEHQRRLASDIEQQFLIGGLAPPSPRSVVGSDKARHLLLGLLLETGRLVSLKTYDRDALVVLHASTLERATRKIASAFPYPTEFAVKDVRDLLGSTRKRIVPLMEHLDVVGATVRMGDLRCLRQR